MNDLAPIDLSLETMRRYFHAERIHHGALTQIGHRYSNLIEQTQNYFWSQNDSQRWHLKHSIARSLWDIRHLKMKVIPPARKADVLLLEFMPDVVTSAAEPS